MVMIQARNILSRGLTGEKYVKRIYHCYNKGKRVRCIDYAVKPIILFDNKQFVFSAYHTDIPGEDSCWREEEKIMNIGTYALMCRTRYFTSKAVFEHENSK